MEEVGGAEVGVVVVPMYVARVPLLCRFVLVLFCDYLSAPRAVAFDDRIQRLMTECCRPALDAYAFPGSCQHLDEQ